MKIKARIDAVCLPADINADYEAEEIYTHVDLPFVPHAGMHLKITPQGDYMTV